ncbi:MAG: DJ-1/PfpI family protein [Sneathiellaceae bacterium]
MTEAPFRVGFLLYPNLTQLDLTGPWEVFSRVPQSEVHLVWKDMDPVTADGGMRITPTATLADAPAFDLLCVPGGPGQVAVMEDAAVLEFLCRQAETASYVTSVCTGSLILAASGLLAGRRAACHWASRDQLSLFGVTPVAARVVEDGRFISGGGVTAGIDFALVAVARIWGEEIAQAIQLSMEYDPAPPWPAGSPGGAPAAVTARVTEAMAGFLEHRREVSVRAARRLADREG